MYKEKCKTTAQCTNKIAKLLRVLTPNGLKIVYILKNKSFNYLINGRAELKINFLRGDNERIRLTYQKIDRQQMR